MKDESLDQNHCNPNYHDRVTEVTNKHLLDKKLQLISFYILEIILYILRPALQGFIITLPVRHIAAMLLPGGQMFTWLCPLRHKPDQVTHSEIKARSVPGS